MVAIFKYFNGLMFTGWIAKNEEEAWAFLDEKFGYVWPDGTKDKCNRKSFAIIEAKEIDKIDKKED